MGDRVGGTSRGVSTRGKDPRGASWSLASAIYLLCCSYLVNLRIRFTYLLSSPVLFCEIQSLEARAGLKLTRKLWMDDLEHLTFGLYFLISRVTGVHHHAVGFCFIFGLGL